MAEHLKGQIIQLKAMESRRRDFLAAVSHAMKTPLTGILSAVEGIRQGALNDPEFRKECLDAIENQSLRLSGLLHDFISLSAIERQEIKKDKDFLPVRVTELVNEAAGSFRHGSAQVDFVFEGTNQKEIAGDPSLLIQAFENLFSNAISHGQASAICVRFKEDDTNIMIDVCDNGSGIAEEHRSKIFERFYRGTAKRGGSIPGNGLGLVIVRRVIALHNGKIELVQGNGKWQTVFRILLPL
jgi:two-component system phosphate regulon sensor histidine kinase PhoR